MAPRRKPAKKSAKSTKKKDQNREETLSDEVSTDTRSDSSTKSRRDSEEKESEAPKSPTVNKETKEDAEEPEKEESDEDEEESSSSDEEEPIVLNVTQRAKRATAGNKMAALLASADQEDEFYKTAYGGFEENNDVDREYKSPVHSDDDEVDSDFDKEEEEDEPVSGGEDDGQPRRKKRKFNEPKRGMTADDILAKNKKWAMARLAGNIVPANAVDDETQDLMLEEAKETEKMNVESLKKYEEFELERKKKRERNTVRVFPPGPRERIKMTVEGTTLSTSAEIKQFKCERPRERNVCAVTGRPARYFDPVTKLPYSTAYAFKVIRDKYTKHLRSIRGNEQVNTYLAKLKALPTPPASPRPPPVTIVSSGPLTSSGPIVTPPKGPSSAVQQQQPPQPSTSSK